MMKSQTALFFLAIGFYACGTANIVSAQTTGTQKQSGAAKKGNSQASITGCVDEQEGHYVLVDDHSLQPVANLEAEGFPVEGFAKHVGHKVTLRGTSSSGSSRQVFKVRSIETVSDTCAPSASQQK